MKKNTLSITRCTDEKAAQTTAARVRPVQQERHRKSQHQTIDNHGLLRCRGAGLQAKLKIGAPNDKYEQEADRVADAVMRMPEPNVQRQEENAQEENIQTKPISEQITPLLQRKTRKMEEEVLVQAKTSSDLTSEVTSDIEDQVTALRSSGQPLPDTTSAFFQPRFGHQLDQVRIHDCLQSKKMAASLCAEAFTVRNHIFFAMGRYSPKTLSGRRLLAHELTHVLQQQGSSTIPLLQNTCHINTPAQVKQKTALNLKADRLYMKKKKDNTVVQYGPGETKASETSKMVLQKVATDSWLVYDFQVGSAEMKASKANTLDLDPLVRILHLPVIPRRQKPGAGSKGGLLEPIPRVPLVKVIGSTDAVGKLETNIKLRRDRAVNFVQHFFGKHLRSRATIFDIHTRFAFYPNDSRYNRARNRSVLIVNLGPKPWSVKDQNAQARKESTRIFQSAIEEMYSRPGSWGPPESERRTIAMLQLLTDPTVDDAFYNRPGVNDYITEELYLKGISPFSELSKVSHARKDLIHWIVDADSIDYMIKKASRISEGMHQGWFRVQNHPWRLTGRSAKQLWKEMNQRTQNPKSVNYVLTMIHQ